MDTNATILQRTEEDRIPNAPKRASPGMTAGQRASPAQAPRANATPTRNLPRGMDFDLDRLIAAWVDVLRDHSHLANVLAHISRNNWREVERALRSVFDGSTQGRDLSKLARNIVELLCADRGATGRIMKPYFRDFLAASLTPTQARRLSAHLTTLFLELETPYPFGEDGENVKNIAIIQGSSTASAQSLFQDIVERWSPQIRIAGVLEERDRADGRTCKAGRLRSISNGTLYSMFDDAAPGAAACDIEEAGLDAATDAIRRDIAAGRDLIILSKFGKLEAAGGGLRAAFAACVETRIPLLTYVPVGLEQAWKSFAGRQSAFLSAEAMAIDEWLRSLRSIRRAMTSL